MIQEAISKRPRLAMSAISSIFDAIRGAQVLPSLPERKEGMAPVIGTHDGGFHCDEACAIGKSRWREIILFKF